MDQTCVWVGIDWLSVLKLARVIVDIIGIVGIFFFIRGWRQGWRESREKRAKTNEN